jgi:hypothetical protein
MVKEKIRMHKDMKRYIKETKTIIPINSKNKKEFIKMLEEKIMEFTYTENKFSYNEIVEAFGTPNEVASAYIEELDTKTIIKELKMKKYLKVLSYVVLVSILCISLFKIYRLNQLYDLAKKELDVHPVTEIIEED